MTTQVATQLTAIGKLSGALGFTETEITETLKNMIIGAKGQAGALCTNAELMVFTSICAKYELDPFVKEVHAFISGGKLSFCVGVDGWFKIMTRHALFDGIETDDIFDAAGNLLAVRARLYLKGISRPVTATEYLAECTRPGKVGAPSPWEKYPHRMLENKAIAQAVRRGMGISGIIDEDEKDRILDAHPQQVQQNRPVQVSFDAVIRELESATSLDDLQQKAVAMREKLHTAGTWEALKSEFLIIRQQMQDRLSAPIIEDGEVTDIATGEVIQQGDYQPKPQERPQEWEEEPEIQF